MFDEQHGGGGGFLKAIFPCLRKGAPAHGGSMAWVKLVDSEGRVAGHAVLSARISMALLGGEVGAGGKRQGAGCGAGAAGWAGLWWLLCRPGLTLPLPARLPTRRRA